MTNPHLDLLLGYKPNGLVGRTTMDLVAPDARAQVAAIAKQQAVDGCETTQSAPVLRADRSQPAVRITSAVATLGEPKQLRILTLRPDTTGVTVTGRPIKLVGTE